MNHNFSRTSIDPFGLKILNVLLQSNHPDWNFLTFGNDVEKLGIYGKPEEYISNTFSSPWTRRELFPKNKDQPDFVCPPSYRSIMVPPLVRSQFRYFGQGVLFYILYNLPNDGVRLDITNELRARYWIFNFDLGIWVKPCYGPLKANNRNYFIFDLRQWCLARITTSFM